MRYRAIHFTILVVLLDIGVTGRKLHKKALTADEHTLLFVFHQGQKQRATRRHACANEY